MQLRSSRTLALAALTVAFVAKAALATTVFDQLYPARDGELALPYPFSALVDDLRERSGVELQLGFIPLGRSLQRFGADPDYFTSPRIILAVSGNGTSTLPLRDRLFMGYQPAVKAIEIIAFDAAAGRFRFLQVDGYGADGRQSLTAIDEQSCVSCHQSRGPIFPAAPWDETNANERVVARLPATVEGLPVRLDFDGIDQFSRSVHRAKRLIAAMVLKHALSAKPASQSIAAALAQAFRGGISVIDPKLPNRDPLALLDSGLPMLAVLQAEGVFDPETPRRPEIQWMPGLRGVEEATELIDEADVP